jgi:hypothetical protein
MIYNPDLASSLRNMVLLGLATAIGAGCQSGSRPDINADGSVAFLCPLHGCTPDPHGVCQHTCTPDPGPRLVDCQAAEQNFEFALPYIWTFEEGSPLRAARAMYSYTDNTNSIATFKNESGTARQTYQPPTAALTRCWDPNDHTQPLNPGNRAIHVEGGPFLAWGGGIGIAMKDHPGRTVDPASPLTFPLSPGSTAISGAAIDASAWEGVSFWARRGPDSQAGFRVLVGDKYTDDDISYRMYRDDPNTTRYCERVRECACLNHQTCAPVTVQLTDGLPPMGSNFPLACVPTRGVGRNDLVTQSFCGQPDVLSAGSMGAGAGSSTQCNTCELTRCNENYPAYPDDFPAAGGLQPTDPVTLMPLPGYPQGTDRQFYGRPCTPYTMRNGITSAWCFDPNTDPPPAEQSRQCGDHWTRVVNLSNEWQFYTVPFSAMLQQGWAQRSPGLDLTTVSVVRFTFDGGFIDYWIDDVTFYRHKKR